MPHFDRPIEPMTLGNMRELGSAMSLFSTASEGAGAASPGITRLRRTISRRGRA
jgi:hypothetical protein